MGEFNSIIVKQGEKDSELEVINPTDYELIGKGFQGAVFRLSEDRCVKIYAQEKHCMKECLALTAAANSIIVPKLFETGDNYIIMEYIHGTTLDDYLRHCRTFPESITKQILFLFQEMERIGFKRIDAILRHIYVTENGICKVIDHVNSLSKDHPFPKKFFKALKKRNLLDSFSPTNKGIGFKAI